MKKKFLIFGLVAILCLPLSLCLVGCGKDEEPKTLDVNAKDIYAMSAATSVNYLKNKGVGSAGVKSATRPEMIQQNDVDSLKRCVSLFDGVISNNGIKQQIANNEELDENLRDYNFVMDITFPASSEVLKMYYNEIIISTETEIDDFKEEVEVSTRLEGVVVYDSVQYEVKGRREIEKEDNEIEVSIEFVTYLDNANYIKVEQSVEDDEVEYEYTIYENGQKVQDVELEVEYEKSNIVIEFQIKDLSTGVLRETKYKLLKIQEGGIKAVVTTGGSKDTVVIMITDGEIKFVYSNGYEEIV